MLNTYISAENRSKRKTMNFIPYYSDFYFMQYAAKKHIRFIVIYLLFAFFALSFFSEINDELFVIILLSISIGIIDRKSVV